MRWQKVRINELGNVVTGKTPPTKERHYYNGDYPFITPSDLDYDTYRIRSTVTTISDEARKKFHNLFLREKAIAFTCIASIGKIGIITRDSLTNQQINSVVVNDKHDYRFVYYLLRHEARRIQGMTSGVATPIINKSDFKKIEVMIPGSLTIEQNIASILTTYDDLIENNRRRIQLLEQAARLLYKEWFVHLRLPGHEHTKIVDGVPEGWEKKQVKELLAKVNRPGKIQKADYLANGSIPCIDQSREFIGGYTDRRDAMIDELPMIVFGDHTRIFKFIDFPFACGADGTQLLSTNDSKMSQEYFFFSLDTIDLSNYFYARHFKFLKDQFVRRPSAMLIEQFTDVARPIMVQIRVLRDQNHQLAKARDLLLPKLMNGEVAV